MNTAMLVVTPQLLNTIVAALQADALPGRRPGPRGNRPADEGADGEGGCPHHCPAAPGGVGLNVNAYGQRWAPWSWAFVFSIVLWAVIIGTAVALLGGCAARLADGKGGTITYTERVRVEKPPPKEASQECPDAEALHCCCDLSRSGVLTCRCPHPGGQQ